MNTEEKEAASVPIDEDEDKTEILKKIQKIWTKFLEEKEAASVPIDEDEIAILKHIQTNIQKIRKAAASVTIDEDEIAILKKIQKNMRKIRKKFFEEKEAAASVSIDEDEIAILKKIQNIQECLAYIVCIRISIRGGRGLI
jgi:hypothetical protein